MQSLTETLIIEQTSQEPLINFINMALCSALKKKASDIHFEPYQSSYRVRVRIDGQLQELIHAPTQIAKRLSSRLKLLAKLDISEQRRPQDGQISLIYQQKKVSLRISTCCTTNGEKVVLRVMNKQFFSIDELGIEKTVLKKLRNCIHQPQGLILICGPTGSGKTMTLYSLLSEINQTKKNILSIEDPVEINIPGINQVNIQTKIQFSFHQALRCFLRQDPDVIMVGEIRDKETAEAAIKSAQTGHLVLATLHSNSSLKAITRLRNMGMENYDLADSLKLIISQRLIRKFCKHCEGDACEHCHQGFLGRVPLYEFLFIDEMIESMIADNSATQTIKSEMNSDQFFPLSQSAKEKIENCLTSKEEVARLTGEFIDNKT